MKTILFSYCLYLQTTPGSFIVESSFHPNPTPLLCSNNNYCYSSPYTYKHYLCNALLIVSSLLMESLSENEWMERPSQPLPIALDCKSLFIISSLLYSCFTFLASYFKYLHILCLISDVQQSPLSRSVPLHFTHSLPSCKVNLIKNP